MRIALDCSRCGGNRFSLSEAHSDETMVTCKDCGHEVGTLRDLKDRVEAALRRGSAGPPGSGS